jgi:hypothetical protein
MVSQGDNFFKQKIADIYAVWYNNALAHKHYQDRAGLKFSLWYPAVMVSQGFFFIKKNKQIVDILAYAV